MSTQPEFDPPIASIAQYVVQQRGAAVAPSARAALSRHFIDAVGCAVAGRDGAPAAIARRLARSSPNPAGASVIGVAQPVQPEIAAFANSCLIRYLDFNDTFVAKSSAHLSDMMPAVFAAGELVEASGSEVLHGFQVAYEVFGALAAVVGLEGLGWDNGAFLKMAAAAGAAKVLALSYEQVGYAVSLAVTSGLPFHVTRTGELSHWKAASSGHAAMSGLFAARLAREGMTGPPQPFAGAGGGWARALPEFALLDIGKPVAGRSVVQRSGLKRFPVDYVSQPSIEAMIELHREGIGPDQLRAIRLSTYGLAWRFAGGGAGDHAAKWDPTTRETADHSLPFVMAVALVDGDVTVDSFTPSRIADPALRPIMDKITVVEDPALTANSIDDPAHELAVTLADGAVRRLRFSRTRGHHLNPMTHDEVVQKFRHNTAVLGPERQATLLERLGGFGEASDIGELAGCLRTLG